MAIEIAWTPERELDVGLLIELFAPALDARSARAALLEAAAHVRVSLDVIDAEIAHAVMAAVASRSDEVGTAGRLARVRLATLTRGQLLRSRPVPPRPLNRSAGWDSEDGLSLRARPATATVQILTPREAIEQLLASALGSTRSAAYVDDAARSLGIFGEFDRDQALAVLERLCGEPGVVGVTARFAKARLVLEFGW